MDGAKRQQQDNDWTRSFKEGDQRGMTSAVAGYRPVLSRWVKRRCPEADDADVNDILQEVWISVYQNRLKARFVSLRAILPIACRSRCIDWLRKRNGYSKAIPSADVAPERLPGRVPTPLSTVVRREAVQAALDPLARQDLTIKQCAAALGQPTEEARGMDGLTRQAAHTSGERRARLSGLSKLRNALEEKGFDTGDAGELK